MSTTYVKLILVLAILLSLGPPLQSDENKMWEYTDFVWNLGMAASCDVGPTEKHPKMLYLEYGKPEARLYKDALANIKSGDIVWVSTYCVPLFEKEVLPYLKQPIVLLINDGDESFPSSFKNKINVEKFINNENIIHIFAQNCVYHGTSNKVSHVPIGIDFYSVAYKGGYWGESGSPRQQEKELKGFLQELQPTHKRKLGAFVDFQHNDTMRYGSEQQYLQFGEDRTGIFNRLLKTGLIDHSKPMRRSDLWKKKAEYAFSISPPGNGLDCHRTWEDLALGCIVIVRTSPLDPLYEGLPVVIVKDWGEVTQENMENWIKQYGDAFTNPAYREKLTNKYWMDKARLAAKPYKHRIAVVTMAIGEKYGDLVAPAMENKRAYCQKHDYEFICCTERLDKTRPIPWTKIPLVESLLDSQKYDWIFWTDADSVFTNFNIRLEKFIDENYDFILTRDFNNLNSGQFFLKNSPWSREFLKAVYSHQEMTNHMWWEQAAVIVEYDRNEPVRSKTKVVPQRQFNSYSKELMSSWFRGDKEAVYYQPGDFIIHFAGVGMEDAHPLLKVYAEKYKD